MGEHSKFVFIWLMVLAAAACSQQCGKQSQKEIDFANRFNKLFSTNHASIKPNSTGGPLLVEVSVHFTKLDGVSAKDESYNADAFIRMKWKDVRLCHNETEDIILTGEHNKPIWTPDLYIENALKTEKHEITKLNRYIRISPNGDLLFSIRARVVAKCSQDLMYFPLDSQNCKMVLESYAYPTKQLILKWMKRKATSLSTHEIPQFIIGQPTTEEGEAEYSTGVFSKLTIHVRLKRRFGFYLLQAYAPCILVVMLSWLSFWMNPEDVGDRIALGITCVLTLVFLMESINSSLPKVSYAKAIDFYIIGCFLCAFIVVLETVIAKHCSRSQKQDDSNEKKNESPSAPRTPATLAKNSWNLIKTSIGQDFKGFESKNDTKVIETMVKTSKRRNIDSYCKVIFPLVFVILNACYWLVCISKGEK